MGERKKKKLKREAGLFHDFPEAVQVAIIQSAIDDAAEQRKRNNDELEAQRKAKEGKEKLLHELNLHNTTEAHIDAIYYYKMYHSRACLKNMSLKELRDFIKSLSSKVNQIFYVTLH